MNFSVICACNDLNVLRCNLLASPGIQNHEFIIKRDYDNVAKAYNEGNKESFNKYQIFVHQDVFLPGNFFTKLEENINSLKDRKWGVLGVIGKTQKSKNTIGHVCDRGREVGNLSMSYPAEVQTLDELLLVKIKDQFVFDEEIPSTHHMIGADICMQAHADQKKVYAIKNYCYHNSKFNGFLDDSFYKSSDYMRSKWHSFLPIRTTCTFIK